MEKQKRNLKIGERAAIISIIAYVCLSVIKVLIGYNTGSEALKADGLNNVTDILASIAVLVGLKLSQKPADHDHPYGHWKAEMVASMVASFIMMAVGLQVLYQAISSVLNESTESPDLIAAWTGLVCAIVMFGVYRYNNTIAKRTQSQAVKAAAKDNLSDAWVSIGASIGIFGSQFDLPWLDPVTAVVVGYLICKTAWDIFREASHHLTDGFDQTEMDQYKKTILSIDGVEGVKDIKARNYGTNVVVDVVMQVHSNQDIKEAHDLSTRVENQLIEKYDIYDVQVHIEPKY
ncbi:cation diffusion facilitator family transporter [Gracilibacillus salinarum]|uniref:Cation diffusion facilitator family transporter n=1 Tax=Gracilibacillus salinarum TaxID=2932255 RepID=A0ABY4GIU7_9BACI|nr:cation diffusion facilitator family transporter [Gracilibacillus salinarum]UOQ84119.1 cation diffusion facilitator family transporter [Gracilibacillus salinarum]